MPVALSPLFLMASVAYTDSTDVSLQCCKCGRKVDAN